MYPLIKTKSKGVDVIVECTQYDQGNVKRFAVDRDLTGEAVRYVIDLKNGHKVADWCSVIDSHTIEMMLPYNCTQNIGTYDAQLLFYSQSQIADSFESWKADVLAGVTPVVVNRTDTEASDTDNPDAAIASFLFTIKVYRSISAPGNVVENSDQAVSAALADLDTLKAEYREIYSKMQALDLTQLRSDVTALQTWKASVLEGSEAVVVEKEITEA